MFLHSLVLENKHFLTKKNLSKTFSLSKKKKVGLASVIWEAVYVPLFSAWIQALAGSQIHPGKIVSTSTFCISWLTYQHKIDGNLEGSRGPFPKFMEQVACFFAFALQIKTGHSQPRVKAGSNPGYKDSQRLPLQRRDPVLLAVPQTGAGDILNAQYSGHIDYCNPFGVGCPKVRFSLKTPEILSNYPK